LNNPNLNFVFKLTKLHVGLDVVNESDMNVFKNRQIKPMQYLKNRFRKNQDKFKYTSKGFSLTGGYFG